MAQKVNFLYLPVQKGENLSGPQISQEGRPIVIDSSDVEKENLPLSLL